METLGLIVAVAAMIAFSLWCEASQQKDFRQKTMSEFAELGKHLLEVEGQFALIGCTDKDILENVVDARRYHDWIEKEIQRASDAGQNTNFWFDQTNFRGIFRAARIGTRKAQTAKLQLSALAGRKLD